MTVRVDGEVIRRAANELAATDPILATLARRNGPPPVWRREASFSTMVLFVLEQQVSLASARAAFARLEGAIGPIDPEGFLSLGDEELLSIGFSRQKRRYCRAIAERVRTGDIDLSALEDVDDERVVAALTELPGVGPWTATCWLLFVLGRPDVWPSGDRALLVAMSEVLDLDAVPADADAASLATRWSPWRSIAARMLWHDYLLRRGRAHEGAWV